MALIAPERVLEPVSASVEDLVRAAFSDAPIMVEIARCESRLRQFNADGTVLMGGMGGRFVGIFQEHISWERIAQRDGYSIYTVEGNIRMARWLYDEEVIKRGQPISSQWECATLI